MLPVPFSVAMRFSLSGADFRSAAAAGEVALSLQHSLNNPLAALMAEAQLLELESMEPEHREAVRRMVELCRRMVDELRRLDGVGRT